MRCGLGWKPGKGTNPRAYPVRALLAAAPKPAVAVKRWWANGIWLDQGETAQCTIYSWLHYLADGPIAQTRLVGGLAMRESATHDGMTALYQEGQRIDGTPTRETDSGLTTDAAAQVMKRHGWIGAYHWAANADEVVRALLTLGPVTLGLDWREPMFTPDPHTGLVRYEGAVASGHQVVLDGVDTEKGLVRLKNSWSRQWARNGFAFFTIDALRDMMSNGAEACVATELRASVPKAA